MANATTATRAAIARITRSTRRPRESCSRGRILRSITPFAMVLSSKYLALSVVFKLLSTIRITYMQHRFYYLNLSLRERANEESGVRDGAAGSALRNRKTGQN